MEDQEIPNNDERITSELSTEDGIRNIHRIGGANIENLRLKPREEALDIPGISVLKSATPAEAAEQMRMAFPKAKVLHEQAKIVGSTSEEPIQNAGFDIIPAASKILPNHYRIIHPNGKSGFNDENLARLAEAFVNTTGH